MYNGSQWVAASSAPDKNANQITIQQNHTIDIDQDVSANNLTVEQNGALQTASGVTATLTVYGDFINNGNVDFYTSSSENVILTFAGDQNSNFSTGSANTDIYQIVMDKDTILDSVFLYASSNLLIQGQNSNAPAFLKWNNGGTFVLGGSLSLESYTFVDNTLDANDGFWLNNANFSVLGIDKDITVYGVLHVSDGTLDIGPSQNIDLILRNHCKYIQDGGTVNIQGSFYDGSNDTVSVAIHGGTLNVALQEVTVSYRYPFRITDTVSAFTMTGGEINIVNVNTSSSGMEYHVRSYQSHVNITGGTVYIGTDATPAGKSFRIAGRLPNVVVDNTNNTKTAIMKYTSYIYGDLNIMSGSLFRIRNPGSSSNINRSLYSYGNIIADGDFEGYIESGGYEARLNLYLTGERNVQITGSGSTFEIYQLYVDKGSDKSSLAEILRTITIDDADSNDGQRLKIYNGTLKVSAANDWKAFYGGSVRVVDDPTGVLWLNDANAKLSFSSATSTILRFDGNLYIDNGSITCPKDLLINEVSTGNNYMNNGSIHAARYLDLEAKFTVNGGTITCDSNFIVDGNGDNEHGQLTVNGGTINVGNGDDYLTLTGDANGTNGLGSSLTVHGGTINIYGRFTVNNGSGTEYCYFTMDRGQINVDPQDVRDLANDQNVVRFYYNSIVNFTGGTLTIVDPQADKDASYRDALRVNGTPSNKTLTNDTIRFGNGTSSSDGDDQYPGFTIKVDPGINIGNIICDNPSGKHRQVILRSDAIAQAVTINTSNDSLILNGYELDVNKDFTNNGTLEGTASGSHLKFTGSSAQTYSGSGAVTDYLQQLTFDNSGSGVTLNTDLGAVTVNLTNGKVYTSSAGNGLLTVYGSATTNLTGGSSTAYAQPYLRRAISSSASGDNYVFPVGSSSAYRLLEFMNLSTGGSGDGFVTVYVSEPQNPTVNGTAGTGVKDPLNLKDIYWKMSFDLSNVTINSGAKVRLTYDASGLPPFCIAQSNNDINGTYNSIGRLLGNGTIQSTSFDLTSNGGLVPTGDAYIVIAQIQPIEGTLTVGNSGDLLNLTAVSDTLAKNFIQGYVKFELLSDYDATTETIPIVFDTIMKVNPTDAVVIRPASGVSGTATELSATGALVILDSINSIRFDGRPGGSGSGDWAFSNTNSDIVFEFRNGAQYDTLSYLTIKSDIQSITAGVVNFAGTTNDKGNSYNVVMNSDITGYSSTPTNLIYSSGNASYPNDYNTIEANNLYDFFNATEDPHGVYLAANSNYWTIKNNRLYQTASRTFSEDQYFAPIFINTGKGHTIDGNIIGYADNSGNGTMTVSGGASQFAGIWVNAQTGATTKIINNVVDGIDFTSDYTGYDECGVFSGIYIDNNSQATYQIGSAGNGNLIGNASTTGSITIHHGSNGFCYGIKSLGYGASTIAYNQISGIKILGNSASDMLNFSGITIYNNTCTVDHNIIGSATLANSIQVGEDGTTTGRCRVRGIYSNLLADSKATITNNTIANISLQTSSTEQNYLTGIYIVYGKSYVENNTIFKLTSTAKNTGDIAAPTVSGIMKNINHQAVFRGNNIYSIGSELAEDQAVMIAGIADGTDVDLTDTIDANFIHNLYCNNANSSAQLYGIIFHAGNGMFRNNMIDLGYAPDGSDITKSLQIIGIYDVTSNIDNFYNNSVFIGGSNVEDGSWEHTFCYYKSGTNYTHLYNNLFINKRSNANSSSNSYHYAIRFNNNEVVSSDYNIYLANGTGGKLSYIDGNDLLTLRAIKVYTQDNYHSGVGDPNFVDESGDENNCDLHISTSGATPVEGMGMALSEVSKDFDGQNRAGLSPVDIGADAGNFTFDASVDIFTPTFAYTPIEPQNCGVTSVTIDVTIKDQGTGLPTSGSYVPKVYYRDKSQSWSTASSVTGSLQSGDGNDGVWEFTLTGLSNNTFYEYLVVAQDQADVVNIGYSKFDNPSPVFSDVNTPTTYPDDQVPIDVFTVCVYPKSTYYVGNSSDCPSCDFATLTDYDDFFYNMNAMIIDKDVTCYIAANTDEPATYPIKKLKYEGGAHVIYIKPVDTTTVVKEISASSSVTNSLIKFDGADSVSINGQLNDDGNRWLRFVHHKDNQATVHFVNDAQYDTVKYVQLLGINRLDPRGIVFFDTTNVDAGKGNDHIVIDHNFISNKDVGEPPLNAVYSMGTNGKENSDNELTYNEIANFKLNAIWLDSVGNGDNWNISYNTIYNTYVSDSLESILRIQGGSGHTISNNKLGGQNANLGQGATTNNGNRTDFSAIYLSLGTSTATNVQSNTIKRIETSYNGGDLYTYGIYVDSGKVNIENNIIDSIATNRNSILYGIKYTGTSGVSISNNTITRLIQNKNDIEVITLQPGDANSLITVSGNTIKSIKQLATNTSADLRCINVFAGNATISSNTIGGTTADEKIEYDASANCYGIYIYSSDFAGDIISNTIQNITAASANRFRPIFIRNTDDGIAFNIAFNTIDNLNFSASTAAYLMYLRDGQMTVNANQIGTTTGITYNGSVPLYGIYGNIAYDFYTMSNNVIKNINSSQALTCIYATVSGGRDITITGNQISDFNISSDITFTGINIAGGNTDNVNSNQIYNINLSGSESNFMGLRSTGGSIVNIGNTAANIIGSTSTSNSIQVAGDTVRALSIENASGQAIVTKNTIANIAHTGTGTTDFLAGIYVIGDGQKTIYGNTIQNLTSASQKTDISDGMFPVQGIFAGSDATISIDSNIITGLDANSSVAVPVAGITENSQTATITKNKIYSLSNTSGGNIAGISLLNLNSGYVANNMISLGADDDKNYIGIWLPTANSNTKNIFFNSVYIGGSASGGNSYGLLRGNNSTPLNLKNNIFANFRTGGSGKHYAIATENTSDWTRSYADANNYYSATSSTVGLWGSTDCDFDTWIANTGENDHHLTTDAQPTFTDPGTCDLHLSDYSNACAYNYVGVPIAQVTQDFDGDTRDANHPDLGADEFTPTGRSGPYVWRGWNSSNWDDAANWQCQQAPPDDAAQDVIVYDMDSDPVIARNDMTNPVKINSLVIYPNADFTIMPKSALTLSGNLTLNGNLILQAQTEYDTIGSIIDNGTITGSGKLIARKIMGDGHWHEVSSPVSSSDATSAIFTRSNPSGNFNRNFYYYDETVDLDDNSSTEPAGSFDSQYLTKGWKYAHNGATGADVNLNVGQGYIFWTDMRQYVTFQGAPNTGDYTVSLSYTNNDPDDDGDTLPDLYDGWNLIGNPYPSYLDWDQIRSNLPSGLDDAIYVWDNSQYAGYVNGSKVMSGNLGNLIPPMQGFFVHTTAATSLTLSNSYRTYGNQRYLKKKLTEAQMPNYLKFKLSANGYDDLMAVRFLSDATEGYDGRYDAVRMFTNKKDIPQLFALTSGRKDPLALTALPVNSLPNRTVQLGINIGNPSSCQLSVVYLNGFDSINVWLEDKDKDSLINLRLVDDYTFNFSGGDDRQRFVLHFGQNHAPNQLKSQLEAIAFIPQTVPLTNLFADKDTADQLTVKLLDTLAFVSIKDKQLSITATDRDTGNYTMRVLATDIIGAKATGNLKINVLPNNPPQLTASKMDYYLWTYVEFDYKLDSIFNDPDQGDKLKFSVELDTTQWLKYDKKKHLLYGTPHNTDSTVQVKVTATDLAGNTSAALLRFIPRTLSEKQIVVYPNPVLDKATVILPEQHGQIEVYDLQGKKLMQRDLKRSAQINFSALPQGTYIIKLKGTHISTHFVKQ